MNGSTIKADFFDPQATKPADATSPQVPMPEVVQPIFEVIVPSSLAGVMPLHHFKLWADGKIDGFESVATSKRIVVINRVPQLLETLVQPLRAYAEDVGQLVDTLAGESATPNEPTNEEKGT